MVHCIKVQQILFAGCVASWCSLSLSLFGNHKVRISKAHPQSQSFAATKEITTHSVTSWWVGGSCIISMAAISMAVSALWAQASKLGEGVQGWWN
jgi:hypothetical protein